MDGDRADRLIWDWAAWMRSAHPVRHVTSGLRSESSARDAVYDRQSEDAIRAVDAALRDLREADPVLWEAVQSWYLNVPSRHPQVLCEVLAKRGAEFVARALDRRGVA